MAFIKENKTTLFVCLIAILIGVAFYLYYTKESVEYEFIRKDTQLKDYKINEVIPIYVSDEELARKYLANYVNLMNNFPEKAYELLSDEDKENRFPTLDSFNEFIHSLNNNSSFYRAKLKEFSYTNDVGKNKMYLIDIENNSFIFEQISIMEYKVTIK